MVALGRTSSRCWRGVPMHDALDVAFTELRSRLGDPQRPDATRTPTPSSTSSMTPQTLEIHRRLVVDRRLQHDGWDVRRVPATLLWRAVDDSALGHVDGVPRQGRLPHHEPLDARRPVDGEGGELKQPRARTASAMSPPTASPCSRTPGCSNLWFRVRTLETRFHDCIRCPDGAALPRSPVRSPPTSSASTGVSGTTDPRSSGAPHDRADPTSSPTRRLDRPIEKVIDYNATDEARIERRRTSTRSRCRSSGASGASEAFDQVSASVTSPTRRVGFGLLRLGQESFTK